MSIRNPSAASLLAAAIFSDCFTAHEKSVLRKYLAQLINSPKAPAPKPIKTDLAA